METQNINGHTQSGNVSDWGDIDISSKDFEPKEFNKPMPFLIKNCNDFDVTIYAKPFKEGRGWMSLKLYPGWNPELCCAVKCQPDVENLIWGN